LWLGFEHFQVVVPPRADTGRVSASVLHTRHRRDSGSCQGPSARERSTFCLRRLGHLGGASERARGGLSQGLPAWHAALGGKSARAWELPSPLASRGPRFHFADGTSARVDLAKRPGPLQMALLPRSQASRPRESRDGPGVTRGSPNCILKVVTGCNAARLPVPVAIPRCNWSGSSHGALMRIGMDVCVVRDRQAALVPVPSGYEPLVQPAEVGPCS
jgi:hypothetical protein